MKFVWRLNFNYSNRNNLMNTIKNSLVEVVGSVRHDFSEQVHQMHDLSIVLGEAHTTEDYSSEVLEVLNLIQVDNCSIALQIEIFN